MGMTIIELPSPTTRAKDSAKLVDQYGRVATDLRVSLTDRCNLRCRYCMPAEGLEWLPDDSVLTGDELLRLISVAVERLGVRSVRFTGGEPLLRKSIVQLISGTAALDPRPKISMTTNGLVLGHRAAELKAAGLDRVNVSLDTLNRDKFRAITRRDRLPDVLAGLAAAQEAGLTPVKVNAVLVRDVNDDEAVPLLGYCLERGYHLRFIEQMPLDAQHGWDRRQMVTADEILDLLSERFDLVPSGEPRGAAPAEDFIVDGGAGRVGIIGSVTRPFCGACDRTRLTADGQVRNCLFSQQESDLRAVLRSGADDESIADVWRDAMWGKLAGHKINDAGFIQPIRPMSAIGG
ncbi:GTP 3',8-cyclase MoaA [Mycolicibacterium lutetiense]